MKKSTRELEDILLNTHMHEIDKIVKEEKEELLDKSFRNYFLDTLDLKHISQQKVFVNADISEKYGYKIISGEKHTKQRDTILRLCYAGYFDVKETNRALILYEMAPLYPRKRRDALLIGAFNSGKRNIVELNDYLITNHEEPLKNNGSRE